MPEPEKLYISKITLPDGNTYEMKDLEARDLIAQLEEGSLVFVVSHDAASTPEGVEWEREGVTIVGTLPASADTKGKIYLVPQTNAGGKDIYAEYVTVLSGSGVAQLVWERLGDTEIDFSQLGALAWKDSASGNVSFTTADSAAFSNGAVSASATYTPAGTVNVSLTQTATAASLTTGDYTPEGSVSKPNITVTPSTASVSVLSSAGSVEAGSAASFTSGSFNGGSFTQGTDQFTAPVLTTSVANETLTIAFSAGSFTQGSDSFTAATHGADTFSANTPTAVVLPQFGSKTVLTGAAAELDNAPVFTGTKADDIVVTGVSYDKASVNEHSFSGTEATISSTGTATGDVTLTKTEKTQTVTVA